MNFMMTLFLAEAIGANSDLISAATLIKILAAIGGLAAAFYGGSKVKSVRVKNDPLNVATSENDPISRHEFNLHRAANEARFVAIETNQLRGQDNVERKHIELLATIERAAKVGVEGRVAIWNELKPIGRELAVLQATSNVSKQLDKLGDTLTKLHQTNGRKTTGV